MKVIKMKTRKTTCNLSSVEPVTNCCIFGCETNSKSNPNTVFHSLSTLNYISNSSLRKEIKICNDHYISNEVRIINQDFFRPDASMFRTIDLVQVIPKKMEMEYCRFCFQKSKFTNINKDYLNDISIKDMLHKFNFVNDQNFPQMTCEPCLYELWISYNFVEKLNSGTQHLIKAKQNFENRPQSIESDKKLMIVLDKLTSNDIQKIKQGLTQLKSKKTARKKAKKTERAVDNASKVHKTVNNNLTNSIDDLKVKLEAVLKRENPFLSKVEINDLIEVKQTPSMLNKRRGRPIKLEKRKKHRVLSLTSSEIKDIFDSAVKNREIAENVLHDTPITKNNVFTLESSAYPCQRCNKLFLNKEILDLHLCDAEIEQEFVLNKTDKKCNKCGQKFANFQLLFNHKCYDHKCDICKRKFPSLWELKNHKEIFNSSQRFFCARCDKVYRHQSSLNRHINKKHITLVK